MDLAKVCGCLAVSILPLLLLVDPTEACACPLRPLKSLRAAYCTSDVVFIGNFEDIKFDEEMTLYEFYIVKVLKGPVDGKIVVDLYTNLRTACGYRHGAPLGDTQHLVTGSLRGDRIIISACSTIKPAAELTPKQMNALKRGFNGRCN